jgi:hypothetical protein
MIERRCCSIYFTKINSQINITTSIDYTCTEERERKRAGLVYINGKKNGISDEYIRPIKKCVYYAQC